MVFTNKNRQSVVEQLEEKRYDVLIIGGGITGSGIALDAATRGMSTALVEMQDFAAGTSSRSTKLVHGGLRYLKQFEVKMVAEVGKERAIVYENGPHVTTPEWMLLPMHKGGTFGPFTTSIGLRVYDFLAGVKKEERRSMLSAEETLTKEPLLKEEGLKGGGYYVEYRTDDARLTIEVLKEAVNQGTAALNYAKVEKLVYENGKVVGAEVYDRLLNKTFLIKANKIINATGPWVDTIREIDKSKKGKTLQLTKGVHVVIDQSRFPLEQAIYFDTPDGRMVFAIPRGRKAYVGTTDTFFDGDKTSPHMTSEDRTYIIDAINYMFPNVNINEDDVESSWAGIRPLISEEGKDPSEISRKDEIWESESGLITIAGGKLTGYRKMSELVVNLVAERLSEQTGTEYPPCQTKYMPISGGEVGGSDNFEAYVKEKVLDGIEAGFTKEEAEIIASMYGSNASKLFAYQNNDDEINLDKVLYSQLRYALDEEMIATPVDFFIRRTGKLLFNIHDVLETKEAVIAYMKKEFDWSDEVTKAYTKELERELLNATVPEDLQ